MKRKNKNMTMIVVLLVMIGVMVFTMYSAKNHSAINVTNLPNEKAGMSPNGSIGTPPSISNEGNGGQPPEMPNDRNDIRMMPNKNDRNIQLPNMNRSNLQTIYYISFGVESLIISLIIIYLIISKFNKKTLKEVFKTKDKITIFALSSILLIFGIVFAIVLFTNNYSIPSIKYKEQSSEKDEIDLNKNNIVKAGNIDLSKYETDITITESGTYTFSGKFKNSIIVNAENQDVEIVLNEVDIETESTATIIGLLANTITINTVDGTENKLTDRGNSQYDGCIFSNAELVFEGSGTLIINGNQNEGEGIATEAKDITINSGTLIITSNDDGINAGGDGSTITINGGNVYVDASGDGIDSNKDAIINGGTLFVMGSDIGGDAGIDTDEGFVINGGIVVALGSDMIETPKEVSKQTTLIFSLNDKIDKDTLVTLMKDDEVIVSFEATKSFKTIIISSDTLDNGDYTLYKDGINTGTLENGIYQYGEYIKGDTIKVNNEDIFNVSKIINIFGSNR